jgi:uncharacterized protein
MRGQPDIAYNDDFRSQYAAASSPLALRAAFIQRTYAHVFAAILALVGIEAALLYTGAAEQVLTSVFSNGKAGWVVLMLLFVGGGYVAQMLAASRSRPLAYAGLTGYVLLEALILLPLMYRAEILFPGKQLALQAGCITLLVFGGLTAAVFLSGKDFSFMGPALTVLSLAALGLVLASVFIGFSLGLVFAVAMVVLAAGFIIYDTSNIMLHYSTEDHVPAALSLFASVATMFFYVLRILTSLNSRD